MKYLLLVLFLCSHPALAQSDKTTEFVAQAQAMMNAGSFAEAASFYESAIFAGHINGHLFYNYGIALYRSGDVGAAMAAFLAAKRYLPRNADVKANLGYVHSKIKDDLSYDFTLPIWAKIFFWIQSSTKKEQFQVFAVFLFLCCLAFALYQFQVAPQLSLWSGLVSVVFALIFLTGLWVDYTVMHRVGAVHSELAKAYSGPSDNGNSIVFEVSEGSPVQILESDNDWAKVALSDGKRGWIAKSQIRVY